ncbi:MAG: hypothetical protein CBC25_05015 [Pelagibacteraceae bacterium TMED65]|mgnify:FL=1|nr:hypothetical protein [Rickettsiales bacterium]OUU51608.1 MAG: hypothetical protein CBC25_05015 [Pelagibacteraceae bacterium TMED65]|tara:strand:+ start:2794 stop:3078 length:285 start_codon:yes stop_codon:yes gene_type:complete
MITNNRKEKDYIKFIFLNKLIAFSFSLVTLIVYFSFILIIGFYPEVLGVFLFDSFITVGIIIGLSIIIFSIFLTLLYTLVANNFLDKLREKINK